MDGVRKIRGFFDRVLEALQIGLFGIMAAVGTYQILVRYLFNKPSTVSEELLTYVFAWLSLLAAAYMFGRRGHMRMGFAADRGAPQTRMALDVISECLVFLFGAAVMVYGGIRITSLTMAQKTASLGVPMGYVYTIVPISGGMIAVYSVLNLIQMAWGREDAPKGPEGSGIKGAKSEMTKEEEREAGSSEKRKEGEET